MIRSLMAQSSDDAGHIAALANLDTKRITVFKNILVIPLSNSTDFLVGC